MRKIWIAFLFLIPACTSSLPPTWDHPWAQSMRIIDPADTSDPAYDITAVYLQREGNDLQIRVDMLDFQNANDLALDIKIEDESAPAAEPITIHVPSQTESGRISLDPLLATVTVRVPISKSGLHPRVDVSTPEDDVRGLTLDTPSPENKAPLLLTFHNTLAARLPAEALRSWDGAHSGPRGERHGLKYLLDAAEAYQTPIVLLDLKAPESLSALDAMGLLPKIQLLQKDGLLILPDLPEQEPYFGLSPSPFSWNVMISRHTFALSSDTNHLHHSLFSQTTYLPVASETDTNQPTPDGPSLDIRRKLLDLALNDDNKDLLVLGGSLPNTTWGSPDMVGATLAYFASRPYIQVLGTDDLLAFPPKVAQPKILPRQAEPPNRLSLQTQSALEFAASWAENAPSAQFAYCQDVSFPDCVLANDSNLAIFDKQGARLTYLFAVERIDSPPVGRITNSRYELHQLIGPSWQVAPGVDIYPGAFADTDDSYQPYTPAVSEGSLVFTSQDGSRIKSFRLTSSGLEVVYQTQKPVRTQIPLLVDPGTRFTSGWAEKYRHENTPGGIVWGLRDGPMVSVHTAPTGRSEGAITMQAFNESLPLLRFPEDPDYDYPPGHYIPFPMAIVDAEMKAGYFLRLERFAP